MSTGGTLSVGCGCGVGCRSGIIDSDKDRPLIISGYTPANMGTWMGYQPDPIFLNRCERCNCMKPPLTHHCSSCGHCILRMDHHCPWVNNCVGALNQKHFILFTTYVMLSSICARPSPPFLSTLSPPPVNRLLG